MAPHRPPEAGDAELDRFYAPLASRLQGLWTYPSSYIGALTGIVIVNTGSVSMSYDGDRRAHTSYWMDTPDIRRVEYDCDREIKALANAAFPHSMVAKNARWRPGSRCPKHYLRPPTFRKVGKTRIGRMSA